MTTDLGLFDFTLDATGDMSSDQYKAVTASSSDVSGECAVVATRGGAFVGVLQDKSTAAGIGSRVRNLGITKMVAGDSSGMETAITEGSVVVASSKGQAVPSTASSLHRVGRALSSLSTGSTGIIKVLLMPGLTT